MSNVIKNVVIAVNTNLASAAKLGDALRLAAPELMGLDRDAIGGKLAPVLLAIANKYGVAVVGFKFHEAGDETETQSPPVKAARMYMKRNILDPLAALGVDAFARKRESSNQVDPVAKLLAAFEKLSPAEKRRFKASVTA